MEPMEAGIIYNRPQLSPGQVNCRRYDWTDATVNYYTCMQLALRWEITIEKFYILNPDVDKNCKTIKPDTMYCLGGFIEPVRAYDGLCGPKHNNATCLGMSQDKPRLKDLHVYLHREDCRPGTCFEGHCEGADVYSIDGASCGQNHGGLKCGGKWGDCCNFDGKCGTGPNFCDKGKCESGNCSFAGAPGRIAGDPGGVPWLEGTTPDGTCGPANHGYTCSVWRGPCCSKDGLCGAEAKHCGDGCQANVFLNLKSDLLNLEDILFSIHRIFFNYLALCSDDFPHGF
ncbi:hypothetical protein B0T22DRAFT_494504 [Podospora appendiculata]|uniref:Chitin-binding type-1 domain-containing protein n=1 Tax=Podospora appendiculata TaxID=314037 RepID=A0AAE0X1M6_9PEZI|nr:hypothetical protein B0T22DRAFT_494504 [Podospora appendiculata]